MGDRWKTILLATLVAAIIWVFAEGESLRSQRATIRVTFAPAEGELQLLRTPAGWAGEVVVGIEGATTAVDRFEEVIREPIVLRAGLDFTGESGGVDLRAALREHAAFRGLGVAITSADPPSVEVDVDELVGIELPVRVEVASGEASGAPQAEPARVLVMVPKSARNRLASDAFVAAIVPAEQTATLVPGREERLASVALGAPEGVHDVPGVRLVPPAVAVVLTLKHTTAEWVLVSVPVHIRIAPARLAEFNVELAEDTQFLRNVTVRGPRELIARIESAEINVIAMVTLSLEELEKGITEKAATFGDFPGVLEFVVERPIISLKITRLTPGDPSPPPPG